MVSLFRQFSVWSCGVLLVFSNTSACAESNPDIFLSSDARWSHDEIVAYVPRQLAETPAVALAKINIAVYNAKQLTEQQLCVGKWTPRGTLLYRQGPRPYDNKGNNGVWFIQTFRSPENLICSDVTRAEYFMEMSRHLPEWVSVRPAGQTITFRLGQIFREGQQPLAAR